MAADSAAQLAAIAAISEPEKENMANGASAMVSDALRLQPLLARAEALKTDKKWQSSTAAQTQDGEMCYNITELCSGFWSHHTMCELKLS